jgi:hypothetical protein
MAMDTPERSFPPFETERVLLELIDGFRARTLPHAAWTHQAHLAVGLWHVLTFGEDASKAMLREGIRRYNEAVGTPNSDTRGYHETVTMFYVWAAARFAEQSPPGALLELVNGFVASRLGSKAAAFDYWSRERLLSIEARHNWLEPDLRPLGT